MEWQNWLTVFKHAYHFHICLSNQQFATHVWSLKKVNNLLDDSTAVKEMDTYTLELCKRLKPLENWWRLRGVPVTFERLILKKYAHVIRYNIF